MFKCVSCEKPCDPDGLNVFGSPVCCMSCYSAEMQRVRLIQRELPLGFDGGENGLSP